MAIVPNRAARNVPNGLEPVIPLEPLLEPLEPVEPLLLGLPCSLTVTFSVVVVVDPSG